MNNHFKKAPICEACGKREAISFSLLRGKEWKFTCECTADIEAYYVPIGEYFASAIDNVDWNAHLHEKVWMDWKNFMEMMHRFRRVTGSFR